MPLNGGALLARTLSEVTDVVFTLHGGHLDSFFQGCAEYGIRLVDFRHEAAAVNAADAYARMTGRLGVAAITSGPGFTNGLAGISNAYADGSPVLVITSSPPLGELETRELQGGIDQVAVARPVTKWAHRITSAQRAADLAGLAVRHALGGRPGPVLLELPIDVAFTPVDESRLSSSGVPAIGPRAVPAASTVAAAAALLRGATRPALVVGEGALWSDDPDAIVEFAERAGIPMFYSGPARRSLPADHPLNAHAVGSLFALGANGPDVLLLLGAPMGIFTGGAAVALPGAKVIAVDADAADIGRLRRVELAAEGDCGAFARALLGVPGSWPDTSEWLDRATWAHRAVESAFLEAPTMVDGRIHPYHAAKAALAALEPGCIVVQDGGEAQCWAGTAEAHAKPLAVLGLGYQGHLGISTGYSIGAQIAEPDRQVLVITGDGAIGFNIQELDTMVRHGLPIVTVVFANDTWGMSIHGQEAVFGTGRDLVTRLAPTRYEDVAMAFGGHGERVTDPNEVGPAVQRAFASGKAAIVNVVISNDIVHPTTMAMLGDLTAADEIVVPYYKNLPR